MLNFLAHRMREMGAGSVAQDSFVKSVWTETERRRPATWQHDHIFIVSAPNAPRRERLQDSKVCQANPNARLLELKPLVVEKGAIVNGDNRPGAWYASNCPRPMQAWASVLLLEGLYAAFGRLPIVAEQAMGP